MQMLYKCSMKKPFHIKLKRMQHCLTVPQWEALQALQAETGLTVSEHIRRAIDSYLNARLIGQMTGAVRAARRSVVIDAARPSLRKASHDTP